VQEVLNVIPPDCGYDDWLKVLMGLHSHFNGSGVGLELADVWSSRGTKYRPSEVTSKWCSFQPGGGIDWGTVCTLARQNGADLSAIARRHK